jgi:hypothetical protein
MGVDFAVSLLEYLWDCFLIYACMRQTVKVVQTLSGYSVLVDCVFQQFSTYLCNSAPCLLCRGSRRSMLSAHVSFLWTFSLLITTIPL